MSTHEKDVKKENKEPKPKAEPAEAEPKDGEPKEGEEEPPTPMELARDAVMRGGRSAQIAIAHLKTLQPLLDWAIENNWQPPVAEPPPEGAPLTESKMTSEGYLYEAPTGASVPAPEPKAIKTAITAKK